MPSCLNYLLPLWLCEVLEYNDKQDEPEYREANTYMIF